MTPSGFEGFKTPRAPRRHQSEVDEARHERNLLREQLEEVRRENRRLKARIAALQDERRRR